MPRKKKKSNTKIQKIGTNIILAFIIIIAIAAVYNFTTIIQDTGMSIKNVLSDVRRWLSYSFGFGWAIIIPYFIFTAFMIYKYPKKLLQHKKLWLSGLLGVFSTVITISLWRYGYGAVYAYGLSGKWGYLLSQNNIIVVLMCWLLTVLYTIFKAVPVNGANYINVVKLHIHDILAPVRSTSPSLEPSNTRLKKNANAKIENAISTPINLRNKVWVLPHTDLLYASTAKHIEQNKIDEISEQIKDSLLEHKVYVNIVSTKVGARTIRFGLEPGYSPGGNNRVKVADISRRQKDLAIKLKSPHVRIIESPEPGEGLVGLEVPNPTPSKVNLGSILNNQHYNDITNKNKLPFILGEDTSGEPIILDLTTQPHLLIAGATGSGKSVCINSLILSLLMFKSPNELQMILVDPKRVELTPFNGIPHLNTPVVVETDNVSDILAQLIETMDQRYKLMQSTTTRNIESYNAVAANALSYIVLVVDELSDLIMTHGKEVEPKLVRLAQLGRAAGIHIVLATQRPATKVVTGQLKANIPSRISFAVPSQVESRVILDQTGAETLMGNGDLLISSSSSSGAKRGQGVFIEDEEMFAIKEFWQKQLQS